MTKQTTGSLQESLDSFKGKKLPAITYFGTLNPLVKSPYRIYINHENPFPNANGATPKSGAMPVVNRLPKYVLMMTRIKKASELLKELEIALSGKTGKDGA